MFYSNAHKKSVKEQKAYLSCFWVIFRVSFIFAIFNLRGNVTVSSLTCKFRASIETF